MMFNVLDSLNKPDKKEIREQTNSVYIIKGKFIGHKEYANELN